ncbi:MAG: DUF1902 domain-containing protein [Rhodoplanes sp.]
MADRKVKVTVGFDGEAHVWFVKDSDLHGLNVEVPTMDALMDKCRAPWSICLNWKATLTEKVLKPMCRSK